MNWQKQSIKEIKEYLIGLELTEEIIAELAADSRQGVRNLAKKYRRIEEKKMAKKKRWFLMNKREVQLQKKGYKLIAGIDEAGRGPLAGPVVAAAVILKPETPIIGLNDSKKLTEKERESLFKIINKEVIAVGIGIIDNKVIDKVNILQATFLAMKEAIKDLRIQPEYILVDGDKVIPRIGIKQEAIIDGDNKVNAIAAASIIAKVTRDRILTQYHSTYPEYGFIHNKGYGTKEHIEALKKYGPSNIHRFSFSIVNQYKFVQYKEKLLKIESESELYQLGKNIAKYGLFSAENLASLRRLYREQYRKIANKF